MSRRKQLVALTTLGTAAAIALPTTAGAAVPSINLPREASPDLRLCLQAARPCARAPLTVERDVLAVSLTLGERLS